MDNITHGLIGLTVNSVLRQKDRTTLWVSLISSEIPDIDVLYRLKSSTEYLLSHRGISHSLPGLLILAAAVTLAAGILDPKADRKKTFFLSLLCLSLHVIFDLFTSWGTQVLYPFSTSWFYLDFVPIVDLVLIIILASSLIMGRITGRHRAIAAAGAGLAIIFLLARFACHSYIVSKYQNLYPGARIAAMADFSPLKWKVVAEEKDMLYSGTVALRSTDRPGELKKTAVTPFDAERYTSDPYVARTVNFFRYPLFSQKSDSRGELLVIRDYYYQFRTVELPLNNNGDISGAPISE